MTQTTDVPEVKPLYSIDYDKITPENIALLDDSTFDKLICLIDAEVQMRAKELEEMRNLVVKLEKEMKHRSQIKSLLKS
jgi:hypothetical protein